MLTLHIVVAILTLTTCGYSFYKPSRRLLIPLIVLSTLAGYTGIIVSINSTILSTCLKLGLYSLIIAITLYKLLILPSYPTNNAKDIS